MYFTLFHRKKNNNKLKEMRMGLEPVEGGLLNDSKKKKWKNFTEPGECVIEESYNRGI